MVQQPKNQRKLFLSLFIVFLMSIIFYGIFLRPKQQYYSEHHVKIHGIYFLNPVRVSHFSLQDNHAQPFTENNLRNHWSFLFFGFTRCPQVCPITLTALNQMYQILQKEIPPQKWPQIVFITIDPENDSPQRLNQFVSSFNPNFIGARTTTQKTQELEKSFYVTATKIPDGKNYSFAHSTEIILINPQAQIQAYFSFPPQPQQIAQEFNEIMQRSEKNQLKIN